MEFDEKIEQATKQKQSAFTQLHLIMIDTMSEDNNLTEEEWYERIGLSKETREEKFKGWSEKEINQYQIYSTRRARLVSQLAFQKELERFLSTLSALDVISKETKKND